MARGYYKTPEEIEAEKKIQAERYPEEVSQDNVDPTQALRSLLRGGIAKTNTPLGKSLREEPRQEFEMSPDIKRYGYNLFGMNEVAPSDVQIPFPVGQEPAEEIPEEEPAAVEEPEMEPAADLEQQRQSAIQEPPSVPAAEQAPAMATATTQQKDVEKMIQQATEEEDRAALWKQSAKLRDAAMGAGSGTILKTDTSLYEDLEKRAQRPMRNFLLKQELDDKQAKNDPNSEVSRLVRKSLENLGMNMQGLEGVPYSQLEKLYPSLTQALYTKVAADARKDTIEQSKLDRQMVREAAAQAKMEKASMLSDRQITPINDADTAIANLDAVLALAKDEYVGPLDARIPDTLSSADSMAFRSAAGRMTDAYRKMITGAGASAFELQKLEANLPKPTDTVAQFKAKAKVFREELNRGKQIYLRNLKKQGKNVSEFQDVTEPAQQISPEEQLKLIGEQLAAGDKRLQDLKNKKGN